MRNRWFVLFALSALIATLAACGGHAASDKNATSTALAGGPTSAAAPAAPAGGGASAATAAPAGTPATGGMAAPAGGGGAATINVQEKDFAVMLDKSSVAAGSVTFKMMNMGPSAHNIALVPSSGVSMAMGVTGMPLMMSDTINMGQSASITVNLKPGMYDVVCTVAGHAQLGMIAPITVM